MDHHILRSAVDPNQPVWIGLIIAGIVLLWALVPRKKTFTDPTKYHLDTLLKNENVQTIVMTYKAK